jgi:hypothetical protein
MSELTKAPAVVSENNALKSFHVDTDLAFTCFSFAAHVRVVDGFDTGHFPSGFRLGFKLLIGQVLATSVSFALSTLTTFTRHQAYIHS